VHADVKQRLAALSEDQRRLLAQRLAKNARAAAPSRIVCRPRSALTFPLSFAQQRIWFLNQLGSMNAAFTVGEINELTGPFDVRILERSLNALVQRHEALRTTFVVVNGQPFQKIHASMPVGVSVEDLTAVPEADRLQDLRQRVAAAIAAPWKLDTGPLLRAAVWKVGPESHVVAILLHHIVSDGWSKTVFVRELAAIYRACARGEHPALPELPLQYADFAVWQQEWVESDEFRQQLEYWKRQLASPPVLRLPGDRSDGAQQASTGFHQLTVVGEELAAALNALARRENATLFMTLLAAYALLLSRYSGQDEILVGSPIANRNRQEIENLIGCFMNPLPLRIDFRNRPTFRELIARVRVAALGAYAHQDVPFDLLVRAVNAKRDAGAAPLFQVMFLLQNFNWQALELTASDLGERPIRMPEALLLHQPVPGDLAYPLALEVFEIGRQLVGSFEYAGELAALFDRAPRHFLGLLQSIVANPDARIDELAFLPAEEQVCLLEDWNRSRRAEYPSAPVNRLIEAQVQRTPDRIAVTCMGSSLTYHDLNARANRLARVLQARGVGPDEPVAIVLERSLDAVVAVVAVMKAGGAYVPLDPNYPTDRQLFIMQDAGVRVVVTDRALRDRFTAGCAAAVDILCLDEEHDAIDRAPAEDLTCAADPRNLAYLIYTSGSTGRPKGTMVTHAGLANAYFAWEDAYRLRSDIRVHLQMASISFDVFSGDLVRTLCSGGRMVLVPHDRLFDAAGLYRMMREEQVDLAEFVPAVLRDVARHVEDTGQSLDFLRLLIVGSDSWYTSEFRRVRALCGPATRFVNSYGVTEATIDSSWFETTSTDLPSDAMAPIGRGFANAELYILDSRSGLVPVGVAGELCIGGPGLARGYLRRPDLTAEKFVPNPFATSPGERLYRTGDLARFLPDGNIELLGRIDQQVKLRGFRIEVGEIESVLTQHPSVAEGAVVMREDTPGDKRLVAYVVAAHGAEINVPELRRFVRERVPEYMVPAAVVAMDALPLTPNGKIDRRALPAPGRDRAVDEAFVPPGTEVERAIAQIWTDLLKIENVGIHDNFFDLGGHSLLLVPLHNRLRQRFDSEVTLVDLFMFPTIHALAARHTRPDVDTGASLTAAQDRASKQRDAIRQKRLAAHARVVAG
jgi:amino acid adenylation domain-containing protein